MKFNIIGKRLRYLTISSIIILAGVISLVTLGVNEGIEFTSGSVLNISFASAVNQADLKQEMASQGYTKAIIQQTSDTEYIIRTQALDNASKTGLQDTLEAKFGTLSETQFYSVSPMIADETASNAVIAVAIASLGILLYVTWAFRRMPKPFHYGTCAIVALVHDALIALGVFSFLGGLLHWEINLMFITGILAVIGYSVNNTVVIFDRIRENLLAGVSRDFETVVNRSLVETMGRSINTSLTTMVVVLALYLFVGATIQNFAAVLIVGIVAGTFSSVFIAPSLLVIWNNKEWGRLIPFRQTA
ncbi:protein translocase subunit SecF [Chloroflexota bacterium]